MALKIESLHIGMKVRHPQYGVGVVRSLTEHTAEIAFDDAPRTIAPASSDLESAEATAALSELQVPLANLIREIAHATVEALGLEKKDVVVEGLANRWQNGTLLMQPADASLQPKDVPLETFFHKIVIDPEQSASARTKNKREREASRCRQVRAAPVHHALLRLADHVQHPVQEQGRPVPHRGISFKERRVEIAVFLAGGFKPPLLD